MEEVEQKYGKCKDTEVNLLIKLVNKCKDIVENKKTDAITWKEKQRALTKITNESNALYGSCRKTKIIRGKYENIKRTKKNCYGKRKCVRTWWRNR